MKRRIFKILLPFLVLTSINNNCKAHNVPGYIKNENQDTIYGKIKLHKFNQSTGALILHGLDFESLYYKVSFKSHTDKSYKTFSSAMIQGFGFNYNSTEFVFNRFLLDKKDVFKEGKQEFRFLCLIYKGSMSLYQNIISINDPSIRSYNDKYLTYYEYFLYSNLKGLLKVEMNEQIRTIKDLLQQFDIEEKYIQEIPENAKFKDIKMILENYDRWLSIHYPNCAYL